MKNENVIQKENNNSFLYLIAMIVFALILLKTLNIQTTEYGIKCNQGIVECSYSDLQFNYQAGNRHWISIGAISLGSIVSFGYILIKTFKKPRFLQIICLLISALVITGKVLFIQKDLEYGNKIQTNKKNIEVICQKSKNK